MSDALGTPPTPASPTANTCTLNTAGSPPPTSRPILMAARPAPVPHLDLFQIHRHPRANARVRLPADPVLQLRPDLLHLPLRRPHTRRIRPLQRQLRPALFRRDAGKRHRSDLG